MFDPKHLAAICVTIPRIVMVMSMVMAMVMTMVMAMVMIITILSFVTQLVG